MTSLESLPGRLALRHRAAQRDKPAKRLTIHIEIIKAICHLAAVLRNSALRVIDGRL